MPRDGDWERLMPGDDPDDGWFHFRAGATAIVEEACEAAGGGAWVVTQADGDSLVVLCAAGETPVLREGETVVLGGANEMVLPLELPDGSIFGALCALGLGDERSATLPAERSAAI